MLMAEIYPATVTQLLKHGTHEAKMLVHFLNFLEQPELESTAARMLGCYLDECLLMERN